MMFKALIGKGHEEFATMRQQDAEEFLAHLVSTLRRHAQRAGRAPGGEPTEGFAFGMEQRLACGECGRVRYRVDGMDTVGVPVPAREKGKDAEGKTVYETREVFAGIGAYFIKWFLGTNLKKSFGAMAEGLKTYSERSRDE